MMEKKTSARLKLQAKQALKGNYGICAGSFLIMVAVVFLICFAAEIPLIFGLAFSGMSESAQGAVISIISISIFVVLMQVICFLLFSGYTRLCYRVCIGEEAQIRDLFFAFSRHIGKFIGLAFIFMLIPIVIGVPMGILRVATVITARSAAFFGILSVAMGFLEMLLMLFVSLNYGMSIYILVEDEEKNLIDALKESCRIMKGNKRRLFWLWLTFIGMIILAYCSCGIGFVWVMPYMMCTNLFFYFDITGIREMKKSEEIW